MLRLLFFWFLFLSVTSGAPRILFLCGEEEYAHEESLRLLAEGALAEAGFESVFVTAGPETRKWDEPERNTFPGLLEELGKADVLVVATWRRMPEQEIITQLKAWVAADKPVLGVRTASHAFSKRKGWEIPEGHATWEEFDREVFGANYEGHYKEDKTSDRQTLVFPSEEAAESPLFQGIELTKPMQTSTTLYFMRQLDPSAKVLIRGIASTIPSTPQPVLWTWEQSSRKSVFTTLGARKDFDNLPWLDEVFVNSIKWLVEK